MRFSKFVLPLTKIPTENFVHTGVDYLTFLGHVDTQIRPTSYFEIGTRTGDSLFKFTCDAACVDPAFQLTTGNLGKRKRTLFFQCTSDEFFANYDLKGIFPQGVDVAFLDGLHRFEFLLRDFMNVERYSGRRSIVFMHDCLPYKPEMAVREELHGVEWTGDVWKTLVAIKEFRPDLHILSFDCPPTGLVAIMNLDPRSDVLQYRYHEIVDKVGSLDIEAIGIENLQSLVPLIDTKLLLETPADFTRLFP
jgi:hypothetical protein